MKLPAKQEGGFEKPPAGNHLAVCYAVIDLGTQTVDYGKGKGPESKHQLRIQWELPHETMEDGKPHVIGKTYTYSSNEKSTLVKDLQDWRGRVFTNEEFGNFEISNVIGVGCFLNCVESDKGYVNVKGVAVLPKGTKAPPLVNDRINLDLDVFDESIFEKVSEYCQGVIMASPEYKALSGKPQLVTSNGGPAIDDNDEVPF